MRNKITFLIPSFLCSALLLTGCGGKKDVQKQSTDKGKPLNAKAIVVSEQKINNVYQASGTLLPNEEVMLYPETAGRITGIYFKEGSSVRKGALLVQLYDGDIKAQMQKLNAQRELIVQTRNRQNELLTISGISRQEYDNTIAQLAAIDADIAYNQAMLRRLQIIAPFDGIIGLRNVSEGAIVNTSTLIADIRQTTTLKLDFSLPEQYRNAMENGQNISFIISGATDTFKAKVMAVQSASDANTRTVEIRSVVQDKSPLLSPGAFAKVLVSLSHKDGIVIPSQSIIPTTRDSKVARVKDGKVEIVTVKTGIRWEETVEIVSGLQAGDTVLTTAIMQIKQGMPINPHVE